VTDLRAQIEGVPRRPDPARVSFAAVRAAIDRTGADQTGATRVAVTKRQIAFARRRAFARVWTPDRWPRGGRAAPLVLSVALARRGRSPRLKEFVEPRHGRSMHNLELRSNAEVDDEVRSWLGEAAAGTGPSG
jgi:hypothetical protein